MLQKLSDIIDASVEIKQKLPFYGKPFSTICKFTLRENKNFSFGNWLPLREFINQIRNQAL
jgi:hypothetical protein